MTDTNYRGRVPALALQRNVSEERIAVRALTTNQQRPGHVSDTAARWARRSQVRVTLGLGFGDAAGSPIAVDFHRSRTYSLPPHGEGALLPRPYPDAIFPPHPSPL